MTDLFEMHNCIHHQSTLPIRLYPLANSIATKGLLARRRARSERVKAIETKDRGGSGRKRPGGETGRSGRASVHTREKKKELDSCEIHPRILLACVPRPPPPVPLARGVRGDDPNRSSAAAAALRRESHSAFLAASPRHATHSPRKRYYHHTRTPAIYGIARVHVRIPLPRIFNGERMNGSPERNFIPRDPYSTRLGDRIILTRTKIFHPRTKIVYILYFRISQNLNWISNDDYPCAISLN